MVYLLHGDGPYLRESVMGGSTVAYKRDISDQDNE